MKWADVNVGATVIVKGEEWQVTARAGDEVTMTSRLGERTGTPDANADVQVLRNPEVEVDPWEDDKPEPSQEVAAIAAAVRKAPSSVDPELQRLRDFAISEGFRRSEVATLDLTDLRNLIHRRRLEKVAEDNGVPARVVEDVHIRLTLGATVIAELHTSKPPSAPKVEKMDPQTMRNHLHVFHNEYPEPTLKMDRLVTMHDELAEHERHVHDLEF